MSDNSLPLPLEMPNDQRSRRIWKVLVEFTAVIGLAVAVGFGISEHEMLRIADAKTNQLMADLQAIKSDAINQAGLQRNKELEAQNADLKRQTADYASQQHALEDKLKAVTLEKTDLASQLLVASRRESVAKDSVGLRTQYEGLRRQHNSLVAKYNSETNEDLVAKYNTDMQVLANQCSASINSANQIITTLHRSRSTGFTQVISSTDAIYLPAPASHARFFGD